jgi:acyl-coenzyme A synthetase/AMP-(fatty) acid ligase
LNKQNISICGGLYIVDEIPKTISGKVNRTSLNKIVKETIQEVNEVNSKYCIINGLQ